MSTITRHFYRFDEVRVALLYAIMKGRPLETAFWCQELIDTHLYKECWATLVEAWLWFVLVADVPWITDIGPLIGPHTEFIHLAAYRLATSPKDNSLWAVLCLNPQEMPDTLCANVPTTRPPSLEHYLQTAIHQRKALAAAWAYHRLDITLLSPLTPLLPLLHLTLSVPIQKVVAVLCLCSPSHPATHTMNEEVVGHIRRWIGLTGRRSRRELAIPQECLYGLTQRGSKRESTIQEIRRIDDRILFEPAGSYWHQRLLEGGWTSGWASDDAMEQFYQTYFPDDIPDEWSKQDQEISHGPSVLRASELGRLSLAKLGRIWFQAESRFAWGFYEWSGEDKIIESSEPVDFRRIADDLNTSDDTIVTALLEPVRKLLIVE